MYNPYFWAWTCLTVSLICSAILFFNPLLWIAIAGGMFYFAALGIGFYAIMEDY